MKISVKKLMIALSERGMDYPAGSNAKVFRGKLYVRRGDEQTVDVFTLPLPMVAEIEDEIPVDQSPFSSKFKPGLHLPGTCTEATEAITDATTYPLLNKMDEGFISTPHYMGIAYFWHYEFRHALRDASAAQRVKVHAAFLANGLAVAGDTDKHQEIIRRIFKGRNTGL